MTSPRLAEVDSLALPVWDRAAALSVVADDPDLALSMLAMLRAELPATRATLSDLAAADDWNGVANAAHRCAGGAAYCGVTALIAALQALEQSARGTATAPPRAALAAAIGEIDRVLMFQP